MTRRKNNLSNIKRILIINKDKLYEDSGQKDYHLPLKILIEGKLNISNTKVKIGALGIGIIE